MTKADSELPTIAATPALGFSMQVDLGAGRVATLQTFLPNDCSKLDLNKMLDKMTAAGDRQRAHYQIEGLERDVAELEKRQVQHILDVEKVEEDFHAEQKRRAVQIEEEQRKIAGYETQHKATAEARGIRDSSRLPTNVQANITKSEQTIKTLQAQMTVAGENELPYAVSKRAAQNTVDLCATQIAQKKAEIERNREIVAAGLKD